MFGARPLKRYLQRELETRIGRAIVGGEVPEEARIVIDVKKGELVLDIKKPTKKQRTNQPEETAEA